MARIYTKVKRPVPEVATWDTSGVPVSEMGKSRIKICCPFCNETFYIFHWSIAGTGKRCTNSKCKAMHYGSGKAVNDGGIPWAPKTQAEQDEFTDRCQNAASWRQPDRR